MLFHHVVAGLLAVLSLSACGDKSSSGAAGGNKVTLSPASSAFISTDVTGLGYARDFALTDHTGKPRAG